MKRFVLITLGILAGAYLLWRVSNARTFQFFGKIIPRVATPDSVVALTFDDGPTAEYTDRVLDVLRERGVRATFFVTGREVEANPEQAASIVRAGHELGNHSYSHPARVLKTPTRIREEVERDGRR